MTGSIRAILVAVILIAAGPATASDGVTVSVTLSGSVEEMLPILQHLRDMGFGSAAKIDVSGDDEAIRMQVHSVMTGEEDLTAAAEEPERDPTVLALFDAKLEPAEAKGGDVILLTVEVNDPEKRVDTVAATFPGHPNQVFDLFDNGTQGDRTVGDGVWSRRIPVFPALEAGQHTLQVRAYDVNGQLLAAAEGGEPIVAETVLTVTK